MSAYLRLNDPEYLQGLWRLDGNALDSSRHGRHGAWSGTPTYANGPFGHQVADLNGTDMKIACSDIGTIRTVAFWCKPDTTTEELVLLSAGNDIMVSGGTITYAGVTATSTYVNGKLTTTLAAALWQHVVAVLSVDHAASSYEIGWDGTNYGAAEHCMHRAYSVALTGDEVSALHLMEQGDF